tara:strand:- start:1603 stop:1779 length:177 start_codon:yes stop_codon:yes gene_type:complete
MSGVTEQMLIHAQEFNTRLDGTEQLILDMRQELLTRLIELFDKVELIEFMIKDRSLNE